MVTTKQATNQVVLVHAWSSPVRRQSFAISFLNILQNIRSLLTQWHEHLHLISYGILNDYLPSLSRRRSTLSHHSYYCLFRCTGIILWQRRHYLRWNNFYLFTLRFLRDTCLQRWLWWTRIEVTLNSRRWSQRFFFLHFHFMDWRRGGPLFGAEEVLQGGRCGTCVSVYFQRCLEPLR